MKTVLKTIGILLGCLAGAVLLVLIVLLLWLSLTEYRPGQLESVPVDGVSDRLPAPGQTISLLTFNTGYAGLDASQDFFMDGGSGVLPSSKEQVEHNLSALSEFVSGTPVDIVFLQEVDRDSKRSYYTDQYAVYSALGATAAYAPNYRVAYVPFPLPTLGKVEAGLVTLSNFSARSAERIALPDAYSWPVRIAQLKRCLLVERIPLEGTDRELVLVNLHPEAYDDGEARVRQTQVLFSLLETEYEAGNYVIAGGDWNQALPADGDPYPILSDTEWIPNEVQAELLPAGWQFAADASVPTCRLLNRPYDGDLSRQQCYVIDGFLVSPNVTAESVQTLDLQFAHSDHNPVLLQATLQAP